MQHAKRPTDALIVSSVACPICQQPPGRRCILVTQQRRGVGFTRTHRQRVRRWREALAPERSAS